MIVVAIIGILATIALPAYEDYMWRTKLSEVAMAITPCRRQLQEMLSVKMSFTEEKYTDLVNKSKCEVSLPNNPDIVTVEFYYFPQMVVRIKYGSESYKKSGGDYIQITPIVSMNHDASEANPKARTYLRPYDFFSNAPRKQNSWREDEYYTIVGWECEKLGKNNKHITNKSVAKLFCTHLHPDDE